MKRKILLFVIPAVFSCCSQPTNGKVERLDSVLQEKARDPADKEIIISCGADLPGQEDIDKTKIKGIGLVNVRNNCALSIYFYDSLKSSYAEQRLNLIPDRNHIGLYCVRLSANDIGAWFRPLPLNLESEVLTYQCIDTT